MKSRRKHSQNEKFKSSSSSALQNICLSAECLKSDQSKQKLVVLTTIFFGRFTIKCQRSIQDSAHYRHFNIYIYIYIYNRSSSHSFQRCTLHHVNSHFCHASVTASPSAHSSTVDPMSTSTTLFAGSRTRAPWLSRIYKCNPLDTASPHCK